MLFVISTALLFGGLYIFAVGLMLGTVVEYRAVLVGAILAATGAYFLWTYFIAPQRGAKRER